MRRMRDAHSSIQRQQVLHRVLPFHLLQERVRLGVHDPSPAIATSLYGSERAPKLEGEECHRPKSELIIHTGASGADV